LVLLLSRTALAGCPVDAAGLRADVEAAMTAYQDWEWTRFEARQGAVREGLGCLAEVLGANDAHQVHLLYAISAGRAKDHARAVSAFRAVLVADPQYRPSEEQAAEGSGLRTAFVEAAEAGSGEVVPLPLGSWFVDGLPGAQDLPVQRNAVVQLLQPGEELRSWYLDGGELSGELVSLLDRKARSSIGVAAGSEGEVSGSSERRPRRLLVAGLASGALSGGLLAGAALLENACLDPERELEDAERLRGLNHASAIGGLVAGAAAGGLVVGAVVTW